MQKEQIAYITTSQYMGDKKTIEVSERLFKKLKKHKGNNTWDEHLGKMADATYDDVAYLDPMSITDFARDDEEDLWELTASKDGEIKISVQSKERNTGVDAALVGLSPSERAVVKINEGDPITD